MFGSCAVGFRIACVALFVALAGAALQPARTYAANETIAVSPSAGPVGSLFTVTGSGFTTSSVTVYFNGSVLGSAAVNASGALVNATFQVPNVTAGQVYPVTVYTPSGAQIGFSKSANFTVLGAGSTLGNLTLSKFVQTGSGYRACAAGGGCTIPNVLNATETYALQYQNTANAAIGQITITDTLQPGQLLVNASAGCVQTTTTPLVTVACTVNNIPASPLTGSTNAVFITTTPASGFTGTITNQACATETGFVGQACSNTTYLAVTAGTVTGTMQVCGLVTSYIPATSIASGSITIAGRTFTIAPNAQITGGITTVSPANNVCITFTFVNQSATALAVTANLALVNLVCGVLTTITSAPPSITVGGMPFPALVGVTQLSGFVLGQTYCFLLQSNTIVGVLTGIPTAAHAAGGGSVPRSHTIAQ